MAETVSSHITRSLEKEIDRLTEAERKGGLTDKDADDLEAELDRLIDLLRS